MIFTGLSPIVFSFCALPTLTLSISLPIYPGLIELSSIRNTQIYNLSAKIDPQSIFIYLSASGITFCLSRLKSRCPWSTWRRPSLSGRTWRATRRMSSTSATSASPSDTSPTAERSFYNSCFLDTLTDVWNHSYNQDAYSVQYMCVSKYTNIQTLNDFCFQILNIVSVQNNFVLGL